jgi:hypothetical protein
MPHFARDDQRHGRAGGIIMSAFDHSGLTGTLNR